MDDSDDHFLNVLEDGRVTRFNYQRFKSIELACNFFSILGVILSVYQVSLPFFFKMISLKFDIEYRDHTDAVNIVLLWWILATTIILGFVLTSLQILLHFFLKSFWHFSNIESKWNSIFPRKTSRKRIRWKVLVSYTFFCLNCSFKFPFPLLDLMVIYWIFHYFRCFLGIYMSCFEWNLEWTGMRVDAYDFYDQLDFTYTLNSWFSLWILLRIPLFMVTLFNQTIYASHRSQRIG